ncbi:MAG: response regulator [Gemmatimonadota bacterium]
MPSKILLIDDNQDGRTIYGTILRRAGHEVIDAADGEEGLRFAREHAPDLILVELVLPRLDGWEVMRRLRASPDTAGAEVIAVTAEWAHPLALLHAGFRGFYYKLVRPDAFLETVEGCLALRGTGRFLARRSDEGPPLRSPRPMEHAGTL